MCLKPRLEAGLSMGGVEVGIQGEIAESVEDEDEGRVGTQGEIDGVLLVREETGRLQRRIVG